MDFLNKALAQVADLFRSMTPGARITTGLLLAVVVITLGYLFRFRQISADAYLLDGESFSPSQVETMTAAFGKAALNGYEVEGGRIRIPRSQRDLYMGALVDNGAMPENYNQLLDKELDKESFGAPADRERRWRVGREKQLSMIIRCMQGVQNAFVMYDSQVRRGFKADTLVTASVNVSCKPGTQLADSQVLAIRNLVGTGIAGLRPENVAVTDLTTGRTFSGNGGDAGGGLDDPHLQRKKLYEQQWVEKAQRVLWYVPGATIIANVELSAELVHRRETIKHDPKTIPLEVHEKIHTSNSDAGTPGGRPGLAAQQPPNTALSLAASANKSHQEEDQSDTRTVNLANGERDTVEMAGLTPKRVNMSISVPESYFFKVWQERNPAPQGTAAKPPDAAALEQIRTEETTKIKKLVANMLPPIEGVTDLTQLVEVISLRDLAAPEIPGPTSGEYLTEWLTQHWSTLALSLLALVALGMLRSMVRTVPAARVAAAAADAAAGGPRLAEDTGAEEEGEGPHKPQEAAASPAAPRLRRFTGSGPSLRDELSHLVQEDPEAAANVLRSWIGMGPGK